MSFINWLNAKLSIGHGVSFWVRTSWAIFIFPYACKWMQGGNERGWSKRAKKLKLWGKKEERKTERQTDRQADRRVNVMRKERWKRYSMDGAEGGRKKGREGGRERQHSSCPSPHAARTPPWGDSDFKPLPCFIFPWLLQPDQSSLLPGVTQPSSVQPGPQSPPCRV